MSLYTAAAATADNALARYGAPAVLKSKSAPVYDPATSTATAAAPTSVTVSCVMLAYPIKFIDGTLIRQGDQKALIGARGTTAPKVGDSITWGGADFTVISVKPLAPALVAILYECQLRGA